MNDTNRIKGQARSPEPPAMTPLKLAKIALDNWANDRDTTTLTVPHVGAGARVRLIARIPTAPLGEILCCPTSGGTTAMFGSLEVIAFFVKQGLLKLTVIQSDANSGKLIRIEEVVKPPTATRSADPCPNCGVHELTGATPKNACLGCGVAR